uniref:Uncharacterized protein n=1 Tax=Glossina palpalis gambiensis TaxID=67801 RepID=A0A1B0BS63_9MUSC
MKLHGIQFRGHQSDRCHLCSQSWVLCDQDSPKCITSILAFVQRGISTTILYIPFSLLANNGISCKGERGLPQTDSKKKKKKTLQRK